MPTFKHPCPACGKLIARDVARCPFCGSVDPFVPGRCPKCRAPIEDAAWVACAKCGTPLKEGVAPMPARGHGGNRTRYRAVRATRARAGARSARTAHRRDRNAPLPRGAAFRHRGILLRVRGVTPNRRRLLHRVRHARKVTRGRDRAYARSLRRDPMTGALEHRHLRCCASGEILRP